MPSQTPTIDSQVHVYEKNRPERPWSGFLQSPDEVTGDDMVTAMAKDKPSLYLPGKRSPAWQKIKRVRKSEFVVGGYSFGGTRKEMFSGLLLGLYDDRQRLLYTEQLQQVMSEDNDSQKA